MSKQLSDVRGAGRVLRIGAAAFAAALMLGLAACSPDVAMQAQKSVGEDPAGSGAAQPELAGVIDPYASLPMLEDPAEGDAAMPRAGANPETSRLPRIHLTILSPDVPITRAGETRKGYIGPCVNPKNDRPLGLPLSPDAVAAGGTAESCLQSRGNEPVSQELTFKLPETGDLFWVYSRVTPILGGNNDLQCAIFDPKTWKPVKRSQYACDLQWMQMGNHLNPVPRVRLTKKPTKIVTDPGEGQRLIEQYCGANKPECTYTVKRQDVVQTPESEWTVIDVYNNCGPDKKEPAMHSYSRSRAFTVKDSFGVAASGEFNLKIIIIKLEAKYEHAWTNSNVVTFGVKNPVPWGWADILYAQPAYLEVDGDFTILTDAGTTIVRGANFKLPLDPDWGDELGGNRYPAVAQHSRGVKINCPVEPTQGSSGTKMIDGSKAPSADTLKS